MVFFLLQIIGHFQKKYGVILYYQMDLFFWIKFVFFNTVAPDLKCKRIKSFIFIFELKLGELFWIKQNSPELSKNSTQISRSSLKYSENPLTLKQKIFRALTVVCIKVHKIASVWCKTVLGEVGVSLPWWCHPLFLLAPGYWSL